MFFNDRNYIMYEWFKCKVSQHQHHSTEENETIQCIVCIHFLLYTNYAEENETIPFNNDKSHY